MGWKVLPWLGITACVLPAADSAAIFYTPRSSIRVNVGGISSEDLLTILRDSQIKVFTLAFVLSPGGCSAAWQGIGSITNDMLPSGRTILSLVQSLRAMGGDVIISFGGANGDEPALHCPDPTSLAAVYQSVINRYNAKALDFGIEGNKVLEQASIQRRNLALVALRVANPERCRRCRAGSTITALACSRAPSATVLTRTS